MPKKVFKRFSSFVISFICIFSLAVPCLAATDNSARMTNIESAKCTLTFENGNVAASAKVTGVSGTEKCKVALYIQERQGSRWVTVDTCTEEEDRFVVSANSSIKAEKGTTYRAQATVTVWVNGTSESKTITTQGKTA